MSQKTGTGKGPVRVTRLRRCADGGVDSRVWTDDQGLIVQRDALAKLGVPADRVYADHGSTGANQARPGLEQALPQSGRGTCSW